MINYFPDEAPQLDSEAFAIARREGLHPLHVMCDEPGAKVGDASGVSFFCFAPFMPRAGDRIKLEDGGICEVKRSYFSVAKNGTFITLVPNVVAVRAK